MIYNKPKLVLAKKGNKRRIKVMVMDGGTQTTTKQAPSSIATTNAPREVTRDTKILLRKEETAPKTDSIKVTGSRKEIAHNSLKEVTIWMDEMTGTSLPMPRLIINDSVGGAISAVMEGKTGLRKLCTAGVFDLHAPNELRVNAHLYPKVDLPGFVAHEYAHYATNKLADSEEKREKFWRGDEKVKPTTAREIPMFAQFSPSNSMNTYMNECSAVFVGAAFECREFGGDNKYNMAHFILDRMASHWECDRKEVVNYAKRLYNEIDVNVSRKQIDVALEDRTSVINARKLRGNDQMYEELKSSIEQ